MSKAVLVIDTPEYCVDCPCHFANPHGDVWCGLKGEDLEAENILTYKPEWCPLLTLGNLDSATIDGYNHGWHSAIQEMIGGKKMRDSKECCGNCKFHHHEDIDDGWVCVNDESEYVTDWTEYDFVCDEYERRD